MSKEQFYYAFMAGYYAEISQEESKKYMKLLKETV